MENPFDQVENVIEVQDIRNTKDKVLKNWINNKHAPINIAVVLKNSFIDEAIEIFTNGVNINTALQ